MFTHRLPLMTIWAYLTLKLLHHQEFTRTRMRTWIKEGKSELSRWWSLDTQRRSHSHMRFGPRLERTNKVGRLINFITIEKKCFNLHSFISIVGGRISFSKPQSRFKIILFTTKWCLRWTSKNSNLRKKCFQTIRNKINWVHAPSNLLQTNLAGITNLRQFLGTTGLHLWWLRDRMSPSFIWQSTISGTIKITRHKTSLTISWTPKTMLSIYLSPGSHLENLCKTTLRIQGQLIKVITIKGRSHNQGRWGINLPNTQ